MSYWHWGEDTEEEQYRRWEEEQQQRAAEQAEYDEWCMAQAEEAMMAELQEGAELQAAADEGRFVLDNGRLD